jgi:tetratricopeptide (TPR) repeat protein
MIDGPSIRDLEDRLAAAPSSPLFARLAYALLAHGEIARAETLCERGVGLHPHYATGRLVHARCLAARGRYAEALETLGAVEAGYPGNIVLAGLEDEWRARAGAEGSVAAADDGAVFTDLPHLRPPADIIADDAAVPHLPAGGVPAVSIAVADVDPEVPAVAIDTEVPAVAADVPTEGVWTPVAAAAVETAAPPDHTEVLSAEGVDPPTPVPTSHVGTVPILQPVPWPLNRTSFIGQDRIVSRTLAEIYASQGAIGEAVETYRILLEKIPDRSGQLEGRLRELEERLRTDPGPRPVREE